MKIHAVSCILNLVMAVLAFGEPAFVGHTPGANVYGETADVTQREPETPREPEIVDLWMKVGPSFTYSDVCIYYTLDGSTPAGAFGAGSGTTQTLRNSAGTVNFFRNEPNGFGGNDDWWKGTLPANARAYGTTVKYRVSAWQNGSGGEVFASGTFSFTNKLPWPGAGNGAANPGAGYPGINFWKEEAIFGNTYCAGQIDQNGTVYDFHFPTPGGMQGAGTRNEGYVDGLDTFPPGLPAGWRGQMHLNQAMAGIRVDGLTHWLSNPNGVSFNAVHQAYVMDSNSVATTEHLFADGNSIDVSQADFSPMGIAFPNDNGGGGGGPQRHIYLKRLTLTNRGATSKTVDVYWYVDPALNGGDGYDAMFVDSARNAMVAYDNTQRIVTGTGTSFTSPNEYNPTTSSGYDKNLSVYLASAMKVVSNPGASGGTLSGDSWRDTSGDNGQGWIGQRITLVPNVPVEVDIVMAGAVDNFAGASGTYSFKLANVIDWFATNSMGAIQNATDTYWHNWLASGVTVSTPDARYDEVFKRGLLATELHVDAVNGGVIAGFHNGAYPYVWPRDAVYAAITLARTGHLTEGEGVYRWMKDVCYRDFESWGRKGFWKQKYSTDGYVIWGAPQIDETAVFPWGVWFQYQITADPGVLTRYIEQVRDSVQSMTRDSGDSRLRFEETFNLMYSNNVWEDSYDTFIYSNANIVRGLQDAGRIFAAAGSSSEANDANAKAAIIKNGLDARLDWNGENTDISQLGIVYPFGVYGASDVRANRVIDRINGVAADAFGNFHPLMIFNGEHQGTVGRYWNDGYWNGGPWFLSTLWYGLYYADRQQITPGTADIDNHKYRMDLMLDRRGPAGMGAEQIAFGIGVGASLMYPGQQDFKLQTAWPNAWESMSTLADGVMKFLDFTPDATANTMILRPNMPSTWSEMTFSGVTLANVPAGTLHRANVTVRRGPDFAEHVVTNRNGTGLQITTTLRVPANSNLAAVTANDCPVDYVYNAAIGSVTISNYALSQSPGSVTTFRAFLGCTADFNQDGAVDFFDYLDFVNAFSSNGCRSDFNHDGSIDFFDYLDFVDAFSAGC